MEYKVISAVKNDEEFKCALSSKVDIIFHLIPNIVKLQKQINNKSLFLALLSHQQYILKISLLLELRLYLLGKPLP